MLCMITKAIITYQNGLKAPCSNRIPNNSPPILEHTKCSLHILPTCLLLFGRNFFSLLQDHGLSSQVWTSQLDNSTCCMLYAWSFIS
jgi:hypothetical protein